MQMTDLPTTAVTDHPVPDQHGANLFSADPVLAQLLPLYLPAEFGL